MNGHSGDATLIDPIQRKAVGSIAIGGALESAAAGAGKVFVNVQDQNRIAVVDAKARAVIGYFRPGRLRRADGPRLCAGRGSVDPPPAPTQDPAKVVSAADGHEVASLAIGAGSRSGRL